ncbi:MAG: hypothetical protein ACRC7O_03995, partial [Fimbriiglobus sp.]
DDPGEPHAVFGAGWFRSTGEVAGPSVVAFRFADAPTDPGELAGVKPADFTVVSVDGRPGLTGDEAGAAVGTVARPNATGR